MKQNPLVELTNFGQSIWLDYISRSLFYSGELSKLIKDDHLKGVTSNPSIFEKSINSTNDYEQAILQLARKDAQDAKLIYEQLAITDIKDACDLLRPVYEETKGVDGFACLEVSPHLAFNTEKTIDEALRLFHQVERPNVMIKVPGTKEGMGAIRTLIFEGVSINVTLLFSVDAYVDAANAFLLGLKDRMEKGLPIESVQSVASFFISRIDSKIDSKLENIIHESKDQNEKDLAKNLLGKIAIKNAQIAYLLFQTIYQRDLAKNLLKNGAHPQRLLWASTSTKNKNYSDVLYVESLIGKNTVTTLPLETLNAFRDHGTLKNSLIEDIHDAKNASDDLSKLGIDLSLICEELLAEGVKLFSDAFEKLLDSIKKKLSKLKKSTS